MLWVKRGLGKSEKPCVSPEMSLRFRDSVHTKIKMICWLYCTVSFSEFRSLPSIPLASVTMIRCMSTWVTAWPQPAFSTHWQKWRVNCGRHCKGEWLWVRMITGFNLAPAHSYCTFFHKCKGHQIGFPTENYPPYFDSKHDERVGYRCALNTWWLFIEQCYDKCSNKKWKRSASIWLPNGKENTFMDIAYAHTSQIPRVSGHEPS